MDNRISLSRGRCHGGVIKLELELQRARGVIARRRLVELGASERFRTLEVRYGFRRVRNGWYATPDADERVVAAVKAGGALTCMDALRLPSVWQPHGVPGSVHVRLAQTRDQRARCVPHVLSGRVPTHVPIDDPRLAVSCLAQCVPQVTAVPIVDSILRAGLLTPYEVSSALSRAGRRGLKLAAAVSPCAESGIESALRLILRSMRVKFTTQVAIRGVGRVDFLIGDRLVVEADGLAFHSGDFVRKDRARDLALERLGFKCVRFTYDDILHRPDEVKSLIRSLLARGEHRWSSRNRVWDIDPVQGRVPSETEDSWRACAAELANMHAQRTTSPNTDT